MSLRFIAVPRILALPGSGSGTEAEGIEHAESDVTEFAPRAATGPDRQLQRVT